MSELKFECSHCKQRLACDDQFAGRQITCPACRTLTVVPSVASKPGTAAQKSGMTFVPESWKKSDASSVPPAVQKTGMTHFPEAWLANPETKPEKPE